MASTLRMLAFLFVLAAVGLGQTPPTDPARPNIVLILADDLGWGEIGVYGQTKIRTPNLDKMAAEGVRFTDFHSPAPVCAPSRCMILTGKHAGHAAVRDNKEVGAEGQQPLQAATTTIATLLRQNGYATGLIGKWGLGGPGSASEPRDMGFASFYGFLCQRAAHNHYPVSLWRDNAREVLKGNTKGAKDGAVYAEDRFIEEAKGFITKNRLRPFFLFFAPTIPHVALQTTPGDLLAYAKAFPETPYDGKRGYLPDDTPRATYAAMITRLDRDVGVILDQLKREGLDENTYVFFTSDNGATHDAGGVDTAFFESTGPFGGRKGGLREGGIRVPFIARAPKKIPGERTVATPTVGYDLLPTIAELANLKPAATDGLSLVPALHGTGEIAAREAIYWESAGYGASQAVRMGKWKAIRENMAKGSDLWALYDLEKDPGEKKDVAAENRETLAKMTAFAQKAHEPSKDFPMPILDKPALK